MFNQQCVHCGSKFTYAVPTRARVVINSDKTVVEDAQGNPVKVMCRRCRNCGQDYYEDQRAFIRAPSEVEQKMLEAVRKYREEKDKKKIQ